MSEGWSKTAVNGPRSVHSVTLYYSNTGRGILDGVKKKAYSIEKKAEGGVESNLVLICKGRADPGK